MILNQASSGDRLFSDQSLGPDCVKIECQNTGYDFNMFAIINEQMVIWMVDFIYAFSMFAILPIFGISLDISFLYIHWIWETAELCNSNMLNFGNPLYKVYDYCLLNGVML